MLSLQSQGQAVFTSWSASLFYSAGEVNINHVTGQQVVEQVRKHHKNAYYHPELSSLGQFLLEILQPGDLALFLGAGNLNQVIPEMLTLYREQLAVRV